MANLKSNEVLNQAKILQSPNVKRKTDKLNGIVDLFYLVIFALHVPTYTNAICQHPS